MLTVEQNERLTLVGPGTPAGEFLRRYWQPVAATVDLNREQVLPIRVFGENLVLYKTLTGEMGLVQERCPHRSASLVYGIPTEEGIRCPYHGWGYDSAGRCFGQPFEEADGSPGFKDRIRIAAYPVQELGGLVYAYMGPQPAPLLPRWDPLVVNGVVRRIEIGYLDCNWLQGMENPLDPVHVEWLHGHLRNYVANRAGQDSLRTPPRHVKINFELFKYGILKQRLIEGVDAESSPDWNIGHAMLFPNTNAGVGPQLYFPTGSTLSHSQGFWTLVPADDTHSWMFFYSIRDPEPDDEMPQREVPAYKLEYRRPEDGRFMTDTTLGQDISAWIAQGPIAPRELENLGKSDMGIILYRQWLNDQIDKVENGESPDALVWDESENEPYLEIPGIGANRLGSQRAAGR